MLEQHQEAIKLLKFSALTVMLGLYSSQAYASKTVVTKYNDQVLTHVYECKDFHLEVTGKFNSGQINKSGRAIGVPEIKSFIRNTSTGDEADISDQLAPFFKTVLAFQTLTFTCNAPRSWIYLSLNNDDPLNPLGETVTIHDNFEVEEGMRFLPRNYNDLLPDTSKW